MDVSLNKNVIINGVFIEEQCIRFSNKVKNVGVWLDQNLTMDKHIKLYCVTLLQNIGGHKPYQEIPPEVTSGTACSCNNIE